jgi:uncharacterized OB-fold protein
MTLLERNPKAQTAWLGELPVTSRYTYGLAGERFFRAIKDEGTILGTRCSNCERTYIPAALFCERCMDQLDEWVDVGTTGEVHTFTLLYENYNGSPREEPVIVAFVKLADGGLIHRLDEVDPEDILIGMQVEAVFKPKAKREGSILDITHFKPIGE